MGSSPSKSSTSNAATGGGLLRRSLSRSRNSTSNNQHPPRTSSGITLSTQPETTSSSKGNEKTDSTSVEQQQQQQQQIQQERNMNNGVGESNLNSDTASNHSASSHNGDGPRRRSARAHSQGSPASHTIQPPHASPATSVIQKRRSDVDSILLLNQARNNEPLLLETSNKVATATSVQGVNSVSVDADETDVPVGHLSHMIAIDKTFSKGESPSDNALNANTNNNNNSNQNSTNITSSNSTSMSNVVLAEKGPLWCYIKAKTRMPESSKVIRRAMWFEGKNGNTLRIGRGDECEMKLDDERCNSINARIIGAIGDNKFITLHPETRVYRLVGMGLKKGSISAPLSLGAVIKLGSVSLEVTSLCTDDSEDPYERFGADIKKANQERRSLNRSAERKSNLAKKKSSGGLLTSNGNNSTSQRSIHGESGTRTVASSFNDANVDDIEQEDVTEIRNNAITPALTDHQTDNEGDDLPSDKEDEDEEMIGDGKPLHILPEVTDPRDEMCYICWGGPSEEDLRGDLKNPNPLIRNPCGKCSGSSRYVHLECILRWIKTNGSGRCSVCNGALPPNFSSPPPNIELKVVRHRRGQPWVGTRKFCMSFKEKEFAIIGRDSECDIRLMDRSVCGAHSKIVFDKKTRTFMIQDCASETGTFLQQSQDVKLESGGVFQFKIGRTLVSLQVT